MTRFPDWQRAPTTREVSIMIYAKPGTAGALVTLKPSYGNYIGG